MQKITNNVNATMSKNTKCSEEMPSSSTPLDLPHLTLFKASKMLKGGIVIELSRGCQNLILEKNNHYFWRKVRKNEKIDMTMEL